MSDIFPKGSAWMNEEFIQLSEAKIPILDWGFLRSDARVVIFDFSKINLFKNKAPYN